jgi:Protein of unknown function (DUF2934)
LATTELNPTPKTAESVQLEFSVDPTTDSLLRRKQMQMGANVTVTPGSDEGTSSKKTRTRTTGVSQSQMTEASMQENIANLAYALWQQRGCPVGSPEFDWLEAQQILSESSQHVSR